MYPISLIWFVAINISRQERFQSRGRDTNLCCEGSSLGSVGHVGNRKMRVEIFEAFRSRLPELLDGCGELRPEAGDGEGPDFAADVVQKRRVDDVAVDKVRQSL